MVTKTRNVTKSLAGMEDLVQIRGSHVQTRNKVDITVHGVDVPFALDTVEEMQALDTTRWTYARVYNAVNLYVDYLYDPTSLVGIPSNEGSGSWLVAGANTIVDNSQFKSFDSLTSAIAFVTTNPDTIELLSTASRRNEAECLALSIPYPDGGGADYVVEPLGAPDGYGDHAAGAKQLTLAINGRLSSKAYGIPINSSTPQNDQVKAFLARGIPVHFEDGDYLLESKGANTDAVLLDNYKNDLDVTGSKSANFIIDQVDGDAIRIVVPSNGTGLPTKKLVFSWNGCTFDQRLQKNSLVTPYSAQFPPVNLGTSNTADGLYIVCSYNDGIEKSAVSNVTLKNITTIGGYGHWTESGGDSGIFVSGAESITIKDCTDYAQRDAGVYLSGDDATGTLLKSVVVENQQSHSSANGVTVKRSGSNISITKCHSHNTLIPISLQYILGDGAIAGEVSGNTSTNPWIGFRFDYVDSINAFGNTTLEVGHTMPGNLPDATTFTTGTAFRLEGVTNSNICINAIKDKNPLYVSATFGDGVTLANYDDGVVNIDSTGNNVSNNTISGIYRAGNDNGGVGAGSNVFQMNNIQNCTLDRFIISDAASLTIGINETGMLVIGDGSDRLKFRFDSNGVLRTSGYIVGSDSVVGSRRGGWGATTGATARLAFNADTADLATVRQVLGALLKDLKSDDGGHGLIGS